MIDIKPPYDIKEFKWAYDVIRFCMVAKEWDEEALKHFDFVKTFLADAICENLKDGQVILVK